MLVAVKVISVPEQTDVAELEIAILGTETGVTVKFIRLETLVVEAKQAVNVPPVVNLAEIASPLDGT